MSTTDLKKRLHQLELEAHGLREQVENSTIVEQRANGQPHYEIVGDDEWDFPAATGKRPSPSSQAILNGLSLLLKAGDAVKIGPFESERDANQKRQRASYIITRHLKWPRVTDGPLYESHVSGKFIYVKRLQ